VEKGKMSIWSREEKGFIFREYSLASFNPPFFFFNENSLARLLHWVSSFSRLVFFSFFLSPSGLAISPFLLFHGVFMSYYKVQLFVFFVCR